jgi:hypothetical protein
MTQVPINPPPWGPKRDPHFDARLTFEGYGSHHPMGAREAAERGWWFRSEWYKRLVPDTRRCRHCLEIMFPEAELSQEDKDLMYQAQNAGMATGPIIG